MVVKLLAKRGETVNRAARVVGGAVLLVFAMLCAGGAVTFANKGYLFGTFFAGGLSALFSRSAMVVFRG